MIRTMTNEEAIEIITHAIQRDGMTREQDMALAIAQTALKKQVPKFIEKQTEEDREFMDYVCPNCKTTLQQKMKQAKMVTVYKYKHCPDCGQALDWSD